MLHPRGQYYETSCDLMLADLIIPRRTTTDGASIPSLFWGIIKTPFHPQIILPALYHDYAYKVLSDRKKADKTFKQLLLQYGISRTKANIIYAAVRLFGARYFRKCQSCY